MNNTNNNPLNPYFQPVARVMALAGGYALLFLAILISFEIIARKFFSYSVMGIDDLGGYVLAVCTSIGACYALIIRSHARVDILATRLPSKGRSILNALTMVCMGAIAVFATWRSILVLMESIEFNSIATNPLQTPLWLPQSVWLAGMVFFAIVAFIYAVHAVWLLCVKPPLVNVFYGFAGDPDARVSPAESAQRGGNSHE